MLFLADIQDDPLSTFKPHSTEDGMGIPQNRQHCISPPIIFNGENPTIFDSCTGFKARKSHNGLGKI